MWLTFGMKGFLGQSKAAEDLAPILPALRWALTAAIETSLSQHEPETGHDPWTLGCLTYNQIFDKMARVFSFGNYSIPTKNDGYSALDPRDLQSDVMRGLSEPMINSMPIVEPGLVTQDHINQTPCLRFDDTLIFTQSTGGTSPAHFNWASVKGKTKTKIARLRLSLIHI